MKKLLSLFLSMLMLFTFIGCDSRNSSTSTNNSSQNHTCNFGEWKSTREATCTQTGTETRTCQTCSNTETRSIPIRSHLFDEWKITLEATCTQVGTETHTCQMCDNTETRSVPALSHFESNGTCLYCKKVMNAYRTLAYHIKTTGTYDAESDVYILPTASYTYNGSSFIFGAFYHQATNSFDFCLILDEFILFIENIIEGEPIYDYTLSNDNFYITGYLNSLTFSNETDSLTCTSTNIPSYGSSLKTSFRELAAVQAQLLISHLNLAFINIQITAKDLGFINF